MKCPVCGTILDKAFLSDKVRGCPKCKNIANIDLWQELIRTRKALEIAVDALEDYEDRDSYDCNGDWCGCEHSTAHETLEQITALEQKE